MILMKIFTKTRTRRTARSTMNALARGQFVNINVTFDRDISKLRVATSFKQKDFSKPREPDEMNFMDYILALSTLSTLYSDFGQTNIGLQTEKLITAALVESASKTRKSIIAACERVRRTTTHPGCSWNSDSLASAESRAILLQLPIPRHSQIVTKERTAMRDTPRQVAAYGKRRYSVTFQHQTAERATNGRRVWHADMDKVAGSYTNAMYVAM